MTFSTNILLIYFLVVPKRFFLEERGGGGLVSTLSDGIPSSTCATSRTSNEMEEKSAVLRHFFRIRILNAASMYLFYSLSLSLSLSLTLSTRESSPCQSAGRVSLIRTFPAHSSTWIYIFFRLLRSLPLFLFLSLCPCPCSFSSSTSFNLNCGGCWLRSDSRGLGSHRNDDDGH